MGIATCECATVDMGRTHEDEGRHGTTRGKAARWQITRLRFAQDAQDHIRWVLQQREYLDEGMLEWLEANEKPLSIEYTYRAWQESGVGMLNLQSKVPFMLHTAPQEG